jgi:hypothetical protein
MEMVWLHNPTTGGYFHCPKDAVEQWSEMGWEPADAPPEEPNPVVAERIAWERAQAEAEAEAARAAEEAKTAKPSRARTAATEEKE